MSSEIPVQSPALQDEQFFDRQLNRRQRRGKLWSSLFRLSIIIAIVALLMLFYNILRQVITLVVIENTIAPAELADRPLEDLNKEALMAILVEHLSENRRRVLIFDEVMGIPREEWSDRNAEPLKDSVSEEYYPAEWGEIIFSELSADQVITILNNGLSRDAMYRTVLDEVVEPQIVDSWTLNEALLNRDEINAIIAEKYPEAEVEWHFWIDTDFLTTPMHSRPELAGLRTAIMGSLWMMLITILFSFPIGIGAAIYLEEYATDSWINRIIQVNITNLAGVPSIIYGILGLAVFVRAMAPITSGELFGAVDPGATISGRTILSAGLTMGLLILPIIIINAQEAIRAVPPSQREASYGMGATKLQMIASVLLPGAMPGILTGTILAVSRAFGETAPLVVVGSITNISVDPDGPFSRFTAIPIQIYTWTSEPRDEFRSIAAAAIVVLLVILLMFNSIAIILRNRLSQR